MSDTADIDSEFDPVRMVVNNTCLACGLHPCFTAHPGSGEYRRVYGGCQNVWTDAGITQAQLVDHLAKCQLYRDRRSKGGSY